MKKNLFYGAVTACIALILLVGAVMSLPDNRRDPAPIMESSQITEPLESVTAVPCESTGETTLPAQTQVTEPMTKPPVQPTELATQSAEDETSSIVFLTWPEEIAGGQTGKVIIQGKPNTTYSIQVFYKSGPSGAKGLEDQVSDANGFVTWTWKVSKNTKPGDFKIVVTDGDETAEVPFTVLDKK